MKALKVLSLVLFTLLMVTCNTDDDVQPQNVYLASNGVTVKASSGAKAGDKGNINGVVYTIVDSSTLTSMIINGEDVTKVVTSLVTNMNNLFKNDLSFNQNISSWDVSNVTTMVEMFFTAVDFKGDISSWDVSNVTNMNGMFEYALGFNQDIGSWDVSSVTDMNRMFAATGSFNQDIGSWDVSNVNNMREMFYVSAHFNQDLSSWDVSNVVNCIDFSTIADEWTKPKPSFPSGCN